MYRPLVFRHFNRQHRNNNKFIAAALHYFAFIFAAAGTCSLVASAPTAVLEDVRLEVVPVVINPVSGNSNNNNLADPLPSSTTTQTATINSTSSSSTAITPSISITNNNENEEDVAEDFNKIVPQQQQWIVDYLLRYGYLDFGFIEQTTTSSFFSLRNSRLPPPPLSSAPQRLVDVRGKTGADDGENKSPIADALARFQAFGGIRASGKIDFATRTKLVERRCGVRDIDREFDANSGKTTPPKLIDASSARPKRYAVSPNIRWRRKRLTYKFFNYSASLGPGVSRKLVERALSQWAKAAKLEIAEKEGEATPADITFLFARKHHGDAYRFDGNGAVLAHAFFPGEQRGGEVHFDDDEDWFDRDDAKKMAGVDLFAVALHEIGHALGLGHSSVPDSVMNPWYNNYAADPRLGDDDLHALAFLYGSGSWVEDLTTKKPPFVLVGSKPDMEQPAIPENEQVPDVCDTDFDAISLIRGKIFAFRRNKLWRFEADGSISTGFPMPASDFFMGLPGHLDRIDAFYERRTDHDVIIFSDGRYWRFRTNVLIPGFPPNGRPILELGLPADVQRIDAAFIWSGNLYTYLVARDRYWRLDELRNHVDFTYPRPVDRFWRGVPLPLNSAFLNTDGVTYFVVQTDSQTDSQKAGIRRFIPFDDYRLEAARSRPLETTKLWTGCLALNTTLEETRAMPMNNLASKSFYFVILSRHNLVGILVLLNFLKLL